MRRLSSGNRICPLPGCLALLLFFSLSAKPLAAREEVPVPGIPAPVESPMASIPGEAVPEWQVRLELARILSYLERYDESVREYRNVLEQKPDLLVARQELGRVLFWKGEPEAALESLNRIPESELTLDGVQLKAELLLAVGDFDHAIPLYRELLEANPDDSESRYWLAELLSWQGKLQESLSQYEILLEKRPDDIQIQRKYGLVLSWDGQFEKAARVLKRTLPEE